MPLSLKLARPRKLEEDARKQTQLYRYFYDLFLYTRNIKNKHLNLVHYNVLNFIDVKSQMLFFIL